MKTRDQVLVLLDILRREVTRISVLSDVSSCIASHQYMGAVKALEWVLDPTKKLKIEET